MKREEPLYRPIILRALKTAWYHKELWAIAALAGILGTGTVLNDFLAQVRNALLFPNGETVMSTDFLIVLKFYFGSLVNADPHNIIASFLIFFGAAVLLVALVICAQHTILRTVHRAANNKTPVKSTLLLKEMSHPRFRRLLIINAFFKLVIANLLIVSTLLLLSLRGDYIIADLLFGGLFAVIAITMTFSLNILAVLSLIAATRDDVNTIDALEEALETLKEHPAICFEMSTILFAMNFFFTICYILGLIVVAPLAILIFTSVLANGTLFAVSMVSVLTLVYFLTFTIAFGGFTTTFTYSAWTELSYKIMKARKKLKPRIHHHSRQLLEHFSRAS